MRDDRRRSRPSCPGFLLRFRCRLLLLDHPIPAGELGVPHGRLTGQRPDPDGVPAFRTHELRPGWVPSVPRGRRCSSRSEARSQPAPAALPRPVLLPRHDIPPCEALLHEASIKGLRSSPVRASPRPRPRGGTGGASASPLSFAPRRHRRRTSGAGTGHRARARNYSLDITSVDPPIGSSLVSCDIASHRAMQGASWSSLLGRRSGARNEANRMLIVAALPSVCEHMPQAVGSQSSARSGSIGR